MPVGASVTGIIAERPGEHPSEMRPRQPGRRGKVIDRYRLGVAGIDQVLCPEQIAGRENLRHAVKYGALAESAPEAVRLCCG